MPDFDTSRISDLDAIQSYTELDGSELFELSDPDPATEVYTSKSLQLSILKSLFTDIMYPVGSLYISTSGSNPQSFIGGTWELYSKGTTLIGAAPDVSDSPFKSVGTTGGAKTVTLNTNNIPKHNHAIQNETSYGGHGGYFRFSVRHPYSTDGSVTPSIGTKDSDGLVAVSANTGESTWSNGTVTRAYKADANNKGDKVTISMPTLRLTATVENTGLGQAFDILPPYIVCYIWKRTA